jgi:hypothetical protein
MRSDTAGYQHDLLRYCDEEKNKWCGRIEFTVGCDVSVEFKKAVLEVAEEDWTVLKKRDRIRGTDGDVSAMGGGMFCAQCHWA